MLEIEAKYRLPDSPRVEARLLEWGAVLIADRHDADHYLNAPDRDFARTDEALRLRRVGEQNFLTYKGPRFDAITKTRPELEIPCPPGPAAAENFLSLFQRLLYRPVAVVRKARRIFELHRAGYLIHFCLDTVEGVGSFVELEIVAETNQYEPARTLLFELAAELELGEIENRSYLEMLLGRAVKPGGES